MMHTIHELTQGDAEWHAHRAKHFNASEAAAMLGISQYQTRSDLIKQKATGFVPEVDGAKQALFDAGHAAEAAARPMAEAIIGEDLYPITASATIDGLPLSASYDGATMDELTIFEHKSLNLDLATSLKAGIIPEQYKPQMEQQLLIIGAGRCLFVASRGTEESMHHAWYASDPEVRARLLAGWKQFAEDVRNYMHVEVIPAAIAAPVMSLPAVSVRMEGAIAVISNLDLFGQKLTDFIAGLNMAPADDQEFADTEAAIKSLQAAQAALEQAEAMALAQTSSIDDMRRTVAHLVETSRSTRLKLEKMVKAQKENIRAGILQGGKDAFTAHLGSLNKRLGKPYMPAIPIDFAAAMKNKRTIASLRDAVDTELARGKIEANAVADRIQINIATLRELAADHARLFADTAQIVLKANDDFTSLVKLRIAEYQAAEAKRLEAERERIRAEEEAKAAAKVKAEEAARVAAEAKVKAEAEAKAKIEEAARTPVAVNVVPVITGLPFPIAGSQHVLKAQEQQAEQSARAADRAASLPTLKQQADLERRARLRPEDAEIFEVLAGHYRVHALVVIDWLECIDYDDARVEASKEMA